MKREDGLAALRAGGRPWEICVIGGGATGAAIALDAAARGYRTLLLERDDFGSGTSSRSTKLIHGGVRYLEQGRLALVFEALAERGILRRNAPHLVQERRFVVPAADWWQLARFWSGLKLYDLLALRGGFSRSRFRSRRALAERVPGLSLVGVAGGVEYADGQFDDARLLLSLVRSAVAHGAAAVNYCELIGLGKDASGRVSSVACRDRESGETLEAAARVVINAAGAFSDGIAALDDPGAGTRILPSRGTHVVLDAAFLPGETAVLMPDTPDGRVMFAIPWLGRVLVGTTDVAVPAASRAPQPSEAEIASLLAVAGRHLARPPARADVRAAFAGIRPLSAPAEAGGGTARVSREHSIHCAASGLVSITGGKWTTCRRMAEECLDAAEQAHGLAHRRCRTRTLPLVDAPAAGSPPPAGRFAAYGRDAAGIEAAIDAEPALGEPLAPGAQLCAAECLWAVRETMARTVEDVLARRSRLLHLDTRLALAAAPAVAALLARELGRDEHWQREQLDALAAAEAPAPGVTQAGSPGFRESEAES